MIYDCFMYNGEADLLDIRLNILDKHVDYFVLGESEQTFSLKEKPLFFLKQRERFSKWIDKIIYVKIPNFEAKGSFHMASLQKDYLRIALKSCSFNDVIYYGDADEIASPEVMKHLCIDDTKLYPKESIYKLQQLNYSYFLNNRSSECWQGTNVCLYKNLINLNELRVNHQEVVPNAGWHWTNCGDATFIRNKLDSYDHQEFNTDEVKSKIEERIANGEDYVGRSRDWQGFPFEFWTSEVDLPQYLKDNKLKYQHLWK